VRRRLFSFAAVFSLLLCAATVVIWVRSYWRVTAIFVHLNGKTIATVVKPGIVEFAGYRTNTSGWLNRFQIFDQEDDVPPGGSEWVNYLLITQAQLRIPFWVLAILEIVLPSWWAVRKLSDSRKMNKSRCRVCRYDLTGNTSGICPECGTKIARDEKS
jgi:hypothetical protein